MAFSARIGAKPFSFTQRLAATVSAIARGGTSAPHVPYIPYDAQLKIAARAASRKSAANKVYKRILGGAGLAAVTAQAVFGGTRMNPVSAFYDHRFEVSEEVDPIDLCDFYGTEDFMEVFSVLPIVVEFMMRGGSFDDAGHVHTYGMGTLGKLIPGGTGEMEVAMEFTEDADDDGEVTGFNKFETFEDTIVLPLIGPVTLWKMTTNFGYKIRDDGKCEIYHQGAEFFGPFFIRIIFQLHSYYVIWATERHVNSMLFKNEELSELEDAQRKNIPLQVLKDGGWINTPDSKFDFAFGNWKSTEGIEEEEEGED